jgi:hypothetical protein
MKKNIKKSLNFQRTIILTSGVLVLSIAVALVAVAAWTGPLGNVSALLNTGNADQTKTGGLTVKELSLDDGTGKGDIINADDITGENDLFLHSGTMHSEILLDEDGGEGIKFYTGGSERMVVGDDGNLYVPGLEDCFLEVDDTGKVKCYTGGIVPGGNLLETTQVNVASASLTTNGFKCDSYTVQAGDVEKVVRVYTSLSCRWKYSSTEFKFYINGAQQWYKKCRSACRSYQASKYYHVTAGDVLKVCVYVTDYGLDPSAYGSIYTLGAKRELITHAFSDGNILYWYDQGATGEMSVTGGHYIGATPPTSVIVSEKNNYQVKWILD